jgi:hypothetical protein
MDTYKYYIPAVELYARYRSPAECRCTGLLFSQRLGIPWILNEKIDSAARDAGSQWVFSFLFRTILFVLPPRA